MDELDARLGETGQEHLVQALAALDHEGRERLRGQLASIDLPLIQRLVHTLVQGPPPDLPYDDVSPPDVVALARSSEDLTRDSRAGDAGRELLAEGRVAVVLVAGGQGTRLGFDGPKGNFPFAPITGKTLFAHHAAKISAVRDRFGCALPWYIMTSPQNNDETLATFAAHNWFDLAKDSVRIFVQGTMPAVDRTTGQILLEELDRVALSPDGHGGLFAALRRHGLLGELRDQGVTTMFTFQVDNPLARVARAELLGHHAIAQAEMSNVVVRKRAADERVGVVARAGDRTVLVEYSDLPAELAQARTPDGELRFWAGSIAMHAIEVDLAERVTADGASLPFRRAVKRVPYVEPDGRRVDPAEPNGVKFESFIFDALPLARRVLSIEAERSREFSPIKNAEGDDSPQTARRDLAREYRRWLESAGVAVPHDDRGDPTVAIEIDPRYALDEETLAERLPGNFTVEGPVLLEVARGSGGRTAPS